ncbi:hypothetical protein CHS0354_011138 [Potamilus streckersoni]|uniref:SPRY domain-containing protein n=1 Tax=Potamilus streckersoni TaxID=2493646 RepID=A0AAE0S107_9BIVA|nr:hypothetical protein CHS0354_011138 [Potamilus streckersoni]
MGCGIQFPTDCEDEPHDGVEMDDNYHESDTDEGDLYEKDGEEEGGFKVNIFFTRNGTILGQREFWHPKTGLFPTVGLFSSCEKVKVNLRPLTG